LAQCDGTLFYMITMSPDLNLEKAIRQQQTHHEMRILERDAMYSLICLHTYAYPQIATEPKPH